VLGLLCIFVVEVMVAAKSRRHQPSAEEVTSKWRTLSLGERQKVMTFEDRDLVSAIQCALSELQLNHEAMVAAGLADDSDPFKSSLLLRDAFAFNFNGKRSSSDPSLAIVASESSFMGMTDEFLTREDFFDQLKIVLPDVLSPKPASKRIRSPRPSWKHLWDVAPSSFSALEQNLVKTVEQALWAMTSNPQLVAPTAGPVEQDGTLDEDWMDEDVSDAKLKKTSGKKSKKKRQQKARAKSHSSNSTACPASDAEDLTELVVPSVDESMECVQDEDPPEAFSGQQAEFDAASAIPTEAMSVEALKGDVSSALEHTTCPESVSVDLKTVNYPEHATSALQEVPPSHHISLIGPPPGLESIPWGADAELCGPPGLTWSPWQSTMNLADMKVDDSDVTENSSDTIRTSDTEDLAELATSMALKVSDDETYTFSEPPMQHHCSPSPSTTELEEYESGLLLKEVTDSYLSSDLDHMACLEGSMPQSFSKDSEASILPQLADGREFLPIRPPPGLEKPADQTRTESTAPQAPPSPIKDSQDSVDAAAATTTNQNVQGFCDYKLMLAQVLAQALEFTPEQLSQFSQDAPPQLSSVYRDLLSLQGSLASAFP